MLQFELLELALPSFELLLGVAEVLVQFSAGFWLHRCHANRLILQLLVYVAGLFGLVEGALAELGVQRGVSELFEQFAAFVVVGLEEGAELALGQHHGAGELFEVQPQT